MESISRKKFIKKVCYAGTCLCGFNAAGLANNENQTETDNPINDNKNNLQREWLSVLLNNMNDTIEANEKRKILKSCASVHYFNLGMDEILAPYKHDLDKFISFLESEWGWIIEYNRKENIIIADEDKQLCVCPIINGHNNTDLSSLCYCSEGFAELMFSFITGRPVSATVASSIHRGNKSCIYRIVL
ncbi:hypothetical protein [Proteiniphilum sp. UBA1028]|jgi:hypothetical protein|uniref:hypothetical protein n=1 Tax=Proteiniphilum sp. UBA1028 TaxID=1947251 RepID=UPI000E831FEB|nr:hypothetical protein [Proteiniphilum sp. UBA1028]HBG57301.1 hypothetical protein [Porphyromonadaceae bacterium]